MTTLQQLQIMEVETLNEITKCEIMDRIFARLVLSGTGKGQTQQMASMNHQKLFNLKETKRHLEDLLKEETDKKEGKSTVAPEPAIAGKE